MSIPPIAELRRRKREPVIGSQTNPEVEVLLSVTGDPLARDVVKLITTRSVPDSAWIHKEGGTWRMLRTLPCDSGVSWQRPLPSHPVRLAVETRSSNPGVGYEDKEAPCSDGRQNHSRSLAVRSVSKWPASRSLCGPFNRRMCLLCCRVDENPLSLHQQV